MKYLVFAALLLLVSCASRDKVEFGAEEPKTWEGKALPEFSIVISEDFKIDQQMDTEAHKYSWFAPPGGRRCMGAWGVRHEIEWDVPPLPRIDGGFYGKPED